MEEIAYGVLKVIACIFRFFVEIGIDFGIKGPGRLVLKILWPPYWFKRLTYDGPLIDVLGVCFYIVIIFFVAGECCK